VNTVSEFDDVVLWVGYAREEVCEGPIADAFERMVWNNMPERMIIQKMSEMLDISANRLEILRFDEDPAVTPLVVLEIIPSLVPERGQTIH